jgi:hypothetical protein
LWCALGEGLSAVADIREHLDCYSDEMDECYAAFVTELVETARQICADLMVLIEQQLDFFKYVEGGFGTGDCVIIADGTFHIVDYKHGQGVLVEAANNPQMKLYALGALELFDGLVSWANDIKDYALQAALGGKVWRGWKLFEGRADGSAVGSASESAAQPICRCGWRRKTGTSPLPDRRRRRRSSSPDIS